MERQRQIEKLSEELEKAEKIVVGGASGMSAASGFRFYYQDDAVFRSIAGSLADKYGYYNYFDGYYCQTQTRGEWWALVLRALKYLYDCHTGATYTDLQELIGNRDYYIVTTNQDAQFYRLFPERRITRLQGDFRYFQCKSHCHDAIYYNLEMVFELVPKIEADSLAKTLWPRCPHCGGELEPWVRGPDFLEGKAYQQELERFLEYLRQCVTRRTLFLELGVGMMTPMFIKEPFMAMTWEWPNAFYVSINPQHAIIPDEIVHKSLGISGDILVIFEKLLGRDTSHIETHDRIFNPRKAY